MMRTLRDKRTMHVVLWFLVAVFVSSIFFVFGMKFTNGGKVDQNLYVAKVGDSGVSRAEFNKACQASLDRFYNIREEGPTTEEAKQVREQVLDSMIDEMVLQQTADKLGLQVSDEELSGVIRNQSYFQKNGVFDKATYYKVLQDHQLTPAEFETSQKGQLLAQKIHTVLMDSALVGNEESGHFQELSQRELKAAYVALDQSSFEKSLSPSEQDLKDYYERIRTQFDHPERVKVRHLYLMAGANAVPQDLEKLQKELSSYRADILDGKSTFEAMVKKHSQDERTKADGGSLGWIDRGMLKDSPDFENAIFSLKKGELSQPVKLGNGYDLVQAQDTAKAYKSTFTEVRSKVLDRYKQEKASQKLYTLSSQLSDKLKGKADLQKAAKELGLTVSHTEWFGSRSSIAGLKGSEDIARELSGLYAMDWKGPLSLNRLNKGLPNEAGGNKQYFFQIVDARDTKKGSDLSSDQKAEFTQQLFGQSRDNWLKEFLKDQRQRLDVKTYLNG